MAELKPPPPDVRFTLTITRKSKHSWFPHFKVAYEYGDVLTVREYVPVAPQEGKLLPPLWFRGHVKTTRYHKRSEIYE